MIVMTTLDIGDIVERSFEHNGELREIKLAANDLLYQVAYSGRRNIVLWFSSKTHKPANGKPIEYWINLCDEADEDRTRKQIKRIKLTREGEKGYAYIVGEKYGSTNGRLAWRFYVPVHESQIPSGAKIHKIGH
jgi:hypothetical protein